MREEGREGKEEGSEGGTFKRMSFYKCFNATMILMFLIVSCTKSLLPISIS